MKEAAADAMGRFDDKTLRRCTCKHPETMHGAEVKHYREYLGRCFYQISPGNGLIEKCECKRFNLRTGV